MMFKRPFRPAPARLAVAALLALAPAAQALDFGPFSLTGFAKADLQKTSNVCHDCQRFPEENRHRFWADELVRGAPYGSATSQVTLFQPYLGAKFNLGRGFKLQGLLSQRWRDGEIDVPGFLYERNVALSHEDYGALRIGTMTSRSWALADYPYGSDLGISDAWASSGAGYGMLGHAVRYTSRIYDIAASDVVLEATYDTGNRDFKVNRPRFLEFWLQLRHGDLGVDATYQDSRNGNPQAWGHGPFTALTPFAADDAKLGPSGQSIAMVMVRYQVTRPLELLAGVRRNRWSGAYAVITQPGDPALWNNMFNVDWGGAVTVTENGQTRTVQNPGYPATSVDLNAGARYRWNEQVMLSAGLVHLGQAKTANPSDRGQHNSATITTLGAHYTAAPGVQLYATAGMVNYRRLGQAPLSMPSHSAFTNVDSRVAKRGNWVGLGATYTF